MTTTPRPEIGIPYARADVDDQGYFVTCPECGETFYGTPKGSAKKYGVHYDKTHESAKMILRLRNLPTATLHTHYVVDAARRLAEGERLWWCAVDRCEYHPDVCYIHKGKNCGWRLLISDPQPESETSMVEKFTDEIDRALYITGGKWNRGDSRALASRLLAALIPESVEL